MTELKIYCAGCKSFVGVIRDARLMKGLCYLCPACERKRLGSILHMNTCGKKTKPGLEDIFPGIF